MLFKAHSKSTQKWTSETPRWRLISEDVLLSFPPHTDCLLSPPKHPSLSSSFSSSNLTSSYFSPLPVPPLFKQICMTIDEKLLDELIKDCFLKIISFKSQTAEIRNFKRLKKIIKVSNLEKKKIWTVLNNEDIKFQRFFLVLDIYAVFLV